MLSVTLKRCCSCAICHIEKMLFFLSIICYACSLLKVIQNLIFLASFFSTNTFCNVALCFLFRDRSVSPQERKYSRERSYSRHSRERSYSRSPPHNGSRSRSQTPARGPNRSRSPNHEEYSRQPNGDRSPSQ